MTSFLNPSRFLTGNFGTSGEFAGVVLPIEDASLEVEVADESGSPKTVKVRW